MFIESAGLSPSRQHPGDFCLSLLSSWGDSKHTSRSTGAWVGPRVGRAAGVLSLKMTGLSVLVAFVVVGRLWRIVC